MDYRAPEKAAKAKNSIRAKGEGEERNTCFSDAAAQVQLQNPGFLQGQPKNSSTLQCIRTSPLPPFSAVPVARSS